MRKNNRYGHPKEEVLETLKNSKIYKTDVDYTLDFWKQYIKIGGIEKFDELKRQLNNF